MSLPRYFDTHTHLNHPRYADSWRQIAERALEAGTWMIIVGTDYESSARAVSMVEQFPVGVYAAVGMHPLSLGHGTALPNYKLVDQKRFRELARHPKVVALGEIGLDYHDSSLPHSTQRYVFDLFLELAQEFRLPLILHVRDAHEEMTKKLSEFNQASHGYDVRGVVHHFTGTWDDARRYFNCDMLLSCTDMLARSYTCREVLAKMPLGKLVVESDCPHLTPVPLGAGIGDPSFLPDVIRNVAQIKRLSPDEIAVASTKNALRIFSKIIRNNPLYT